MKNGKSQLLFVGNEPLLSKATGELLRAAGYAVRECLPRSFALPVNNLHLDAVILCATITADEAEDIVLALNAHQLGVPIVSLHVGLLGDTPHRASAMVVDAVAGPTALINALRAIVPISTVARKPCPGHAVMGS